MILENGSEYSSESVLIDGGLIVADILRARLDTLLSLLEDHLDVNQVEPLVREMNYIFKQLNDIIEGSDNPLTTRYDKW